MTDEKLNLKEEAAGAPVVVAEAEAIAADFDKAEEAPVLGTHGATAAIAATDAGDSDE